MDHNALRYSQTKTVARWNRRFSNNWGKIFEEGKPEECDLSPQEGMDQKGCLTHTGKHRWGIHTSSYPVGEGPK